MSRRAQEIGPTPYARLASLFYGPGDRLAAHTSTRLRRAVATWLVLLVVFVLTPVSWFWRSSIGVLWGIAIFSLVLSLVAIAAAETPVETE